MQTIFKLQIEGEDIRRIAPTGELLKDADVQPNFLGIFGSKGLKNQTEEQGSRYKKGPKRSSDEDSPPKIHRRR